MRPTAGLPAFCLDNAYVADEASFRDLVDVVDANFGALGEETFYSTVASEFCTRASEPLDKLSSPRRYP